MRFLCIYKPAKAEGAPPTPEMMETMGKFIEQSFKEGFLLSTEGCLPSALGARVRSTGGSYTVTDGPFTESKEIVGGFALIQAKSKEEAIEFTKRFPKSRRRRQDRDPPALRTARKIAQPALAAK
jgi:hypothetical protein